MISQAKETIKVVLGYMRGTRTNATQISGKKLTNEILVNSKDVRYEVRTKVVDNDLPHFKTTKTSYIQYNQKPQVILGTKFLVEFIIHN